MDILTDWFFEAIWFMAWWGIIILGIRSFLLTCIQVFDAILRRFVR